MAIVQAVKKILQQMRDSDDGILLCVAECCLGCLESLLELFNSFAFVYVGLYGYGFIDAAKAVVNLFKGRHKIFSDSHHLQSLAIQILIITSLFNIHLYFKNEDGQPLSLIAWHIMFLQWSAFVLV